MSGKAFTAHFDGGKLHGQTMPIRVPMLALSVPHFSPGIEGEQRHTHTVWYRLDRVAGHDAYYSPSSPHVTERSGA